MQQSCVFLKDEVWWVSAQEKSQCNMQHATTPREWRILISREKTLIFVISYRWQHVFSRGNCFPRYFEDFGLLKVQYFLIFFIYLEVRNFENVHRMTLSRLLPNQNGIRACAEELVS